MKAEDFVNQRESYFKHRLEFNEYCEKCLREALDKAPDHSISLECEDQPAFVYDGGNHPEYKSSACSMADNLHYDAYGHICVDLEDEPEYEISRWLFDDLINVADLVVALTSED